MAFIQCPNCGAGNLQSSQIRGFAEQLKSLFGVLPFRCRQCPERFLSSIRKLHVAIYARCPKCMRLELSNWSEENYVVPLGTRLLLRAGATPYRCECCRCNFTSYRRCKERFPGRRCRKSAAYAASTN